MGRPASSNGSGNALERVGYRCLMGNSCGMHWSNCLYGSGRTPKRVGYRSGAGRTVYYDESLPSKKEACRMADFFEVLE